MPATKRYAVTRAKTYPFLVLMPPREGRNFGGAGVLELTGDEFADYEETVKKFADWQKRLADAPDEIFTDVVIAAPHGGALA